MSLWSPQRSLRARRSSARAFGSLAASVRIETLEDRALLSAVLPGLNDHGVIIGNGQAAGKSVVLVDSAYNAQLSNNAQGSGLYIDLNNQNGQLNALRQVVVRDVTVANNANAGVQIRLANMTIDRLVLNSAAVNGNGGSGLYLDLRNVRIGEIIICEGGAPQDPAVANSGKSAYSNNAFDGIHVQSLNSTLTSVRLLSNQVQNNAGHGVAFHFDNVFAPSFSINDNEIIGNSAGSGVHFETNRANIGSSIGRIVNNKLTGNSLHGMSFVAQSLLAGSVPTLSPSNYDFVDFFNNDVSDNSGSGISVDLREQTTWDATLLRNTISRNQQRGFDLKAIDTESAFDVRIGSTAVNPQQQLIDGNTFDANVGAAIAFDLNDSTGNLGNTTGRFSILGNTITNSVAEAGSFVYLGQGIQIGARGDVTRQNGAARYFQSVIDRNIITGNDGDGVRLNITEDSELIDLTIGNQTGRQQTFDVNGAFAGGGNVPTVAGDGNLIQNNGGNGISLFRLGSSYIKDIKILDNQILNNREGIYVQASNTYVTVPNAARPNLPVVTDVMINRNTIQGNLLNGVHLRTEANAVLLANLRYNRIDGNTLNGIRVTGRENNFPDFQNTGGTWIKNAVTNNGQNGIAIETVVGSVNPLIIGQDGRDALDNQSLGNFIARNGEDGIEVGSRAGLPGTAVPRDVRDGMEIINNQIIENGRNAVGDPYAAGKGIDIEVLISSAREFRIDRNVIQGNAGDGIELRNHGGMLRVTAVGNSIDLNGGRGVDLLNQLGDINYNAEAFIHFGDANEDLNGNGVIEPGIDRINRNTITNNGLEGFYVVNTPTREQTQDVPAETVLQTTTAVTALGARPVNLVLDLENNEIRDNGLGIAQTGSPGSRLTGTGLVLRIGTQVSAGFYGTTPDTSGTASYFINTDSSFGFITDEAAAGVGSNRIQGTGTVGLQTDDAGGVRWSANGRVNARVVDNEFSGNAGDDVLIESFTALIPRNTAGEWTTTNFRNINPYDRDPLARLNLEFHGNTGDSIDVVRGWFTPEPTGTYTPGARYNNPEGDWKSRTPRNDATSGPFAFNRNRNGQRVAVPATSPGAPVGSLAFHYDGLGASTFRVEGNWDVSGFTNNQLGDDFNEEESLGDGLTGGLGDSDYEWDTVAANTFSFLTAWISDVTVNEAAGTAFLTVTLSEDAGPGGVSIWYKTGDGSAKADPDNNGDPADGDYQPVTETQFASVTVAAGTRTVLIPITIKNDTAFDGVEQFYVDLYRISEGDFVDSRGIVTITPDTDPIPSMSINDPVVDEVNGTATFTVSLSNASSNVVSVDYTTVGGTALNGSDFAGRGGTITFAPGETTRNVVVTIVTDNLDESDEQFQIVLSAANNATIVDNAGTATIRDTRYFHVSDVVVNEGGTATVTISLNERLPDGVTASVDWVTANSTATSANDFANGFGTLTFSGDVTSQTITIATQTDALKEGDEVFSINLSNATNAGISKASGQVTIVDPFEAETDLKHQIGRLDGDAWSANVVDDGQGFLLYGPYTTAIPGGLQKATFRLQVDNVVANNDRVVRIEAVDASNGRILAQRVLHRREFAAAFEYTDFDVLFQNTAGTLLEFRVFYYDTSYVKADSIRVTTATTPALVLEAETNLAHQIGRAAADGWTANTALDSAGYLAFGPYTTEVPAGPQSASFRLLVDNNTANNDVVVTIDVVDASVGRVLAQRVIRRTEFAFANAYQDFVLEFENTAGRQLEFRTFWHRTSFVKLDAVRVTKDPTPPIINFEAETDLNHIIGARNADGWAAKVGVDSPGYLSFGPFTTAVPAGTHAALFRLLIDNNAGANNPVALIDVVQDGRVLAQRQITRSQFTGSNTYQNFALNFANSTGGVLQFRVYWYGTVSVQLDHVAVVDAPAPQLHVEAEGPRTGHVVGRVDGNGWSANTAQDNAGFLAFGPWTPQLPTNTYTANFRLLVDNNTANNAPVVTIDVVDAASGQVLAQRVITRQMFAAANQYQDFALNFTTQTGRVLEFRTYYHKTSYVKQDSVSVVPANYSVAELDSVFTSIDELLLMA